MMTSRALHERPSVFPRLGLELLVLLPATLPRKTAPLKGSQNPADLLLVHVQILQLRKELVGHLLQEVTVRGLVMVLGLVRSVGLRRDEGGAGVGLGLHEAGEPVGAHVQAGQRCSDEVNVALSALDQGGEVLLRLLRKIRTFSKKRGLELVRDLDAVVGGLVIVPDASHRVLSKSLVLLAAAIVHDGFEGLSSLVIFAHPSLELEDGEDVLQVPVGAELGLGEVLEAGLKLPAEGAHHLVCPLPKRNVGRLVPSLNCRCPLATVRPPWPSWWIRIVALAVAATPVPGRRPGRRRPATTAAL